mmetsp:Transcript_21372/g.62325  ORF Transcript_21372/g.62325 Transcript_21372/m.62325 type:complete len:240 (+) Transcript_21372:2988-3707(+)
MAEVSATLFRTSSTSTADANTSNAARLAFASSSSSDPLPIRANARHVLIRHPNTPMSPATRDGHRVEAWDNLRAAFPLASGSVPPDRANAARRDGRHALPNLDAKLLGSTGMDLACSLSSVWARMAAINSLVSPPAVALTADLAAVWEAMDTFTTASNTASTLSMIPPEATAFTDDWRRDKRASPSVPDDLHKERGDRSARSESRRREGTSEDAHCVVAASRKSAEEAEAFAMLFVDQF